MSDEKKRCDPPCEKCVCGVACDKALAPTKKLPVTTAMPVVPTANEATRKSQMPGLILTMILMAGICGTCVGFGLGFWLYNRPTPPPQPTQQAAVSHDDTDMKAQRNVVWKILNMDFEGIEETPEAIIGMDLLYLLKAETPQEARSEAIQRYLNKSSFYFTEEQKSLMATDVFGGTPDKRHLALLQIAHADLKASRLIDSVLSDDARIGAFLKGEKIPLEQ